MKTILFLVSLFVFQYNSLFAQNLEITEIESQISNILEEHNVPGAGVALISKDSVIWTGALGHRDVKDNIPVTNNTLFGIGSISKTFLGAATMLAQERGVLNINNPIEKLAPSLDFKNQWKSTSPVRLVHLLEHTSGFDEAHFHLFAQANSSTPFNEVMKMSKKSLETRWEPGKYFEYNTFGYITAAYILEQNIDSSFEDFVKENILLPLAMNEATYYPRNSTISNFSKGYTGTNFEEVPFPDLPQWPAGALTTSIADLSNFVSMLLNNGQFKEKQILSSTSIKRMETPETSLQAQARVKYGYGKGIWGKVEKGHLFYGHSGRYGGFLSEFGYSRDLDIGYVILINNVDGGNAIKAIKSVLLSSVERPLDIENQSSENTINQFKKITGFYQPITSMPQLGQIGYFLYRLIDMPIIKEENGQMYQSSILGDKQILQHVKDFLFKDPREPMATTAFVEVQDGNWQWLTNDASYEQIPMWWGYTQFYLALICILLIVIGFISLLFWISIRLIRKKRTNLKLQLLPFFALLSLIGMIVSIVLFYDPEKMYSLGAILFFAFGWLFFALSLISLVKTVLIIRKKVEIHSWTKYHALVTSLACSLSALYLFYWDIIGLMLWNY